MTDDPFGRTLSDEARGKIEKSLGAPFNNVSYLIRALTHGSFLFERRRRNSSLPKTNEEYSYERLEFLGDPILDQYASLRIYHLSKRSEGHLTRVKMKGVSNRAIAKVTRALNIEQHMFVGQCFYNERTGVVMISDRLRANVFEALVAAIFLDRGQEAVDAFLEKNILPLILKVVHKAVPEDPKSQLYIYCQQNFSQNLRQRWSQPDQNDMRFFQLEILLGDIIIGTASGVVSNAATNKKRIEREAVLMALRSYGLNIDEAQE